MYSVIGSLPKHQYIFVDSNFIYEEPKGFVPAVWFGLYSAPARMWGLNVMLECGAIYRNIPPHAVSFCQNPEQSEWAPNQSQLWDCYGTDFSLLEYTYLRELEVTCFVRGSQYRGSYLFTAAPVNDGFSHAPDQNKEFHFVELENGRLTIQPTDRMLVREISFTSDAIEIPRLRRQELTYSCESRTQCLADGNPTLSQRKPSHLPSPISQLLSKAVAALFSKLRKIIRPRSRSST
jgi:hypothetical protein